MKDIKNFQLSQAKSQELTSNSFFEQKEAKLENSFEKQSKKLSSSDESFISSSDITIESESDEDIQKDKIIEKKSNYVKVK